MSTTVWSIQALRALLGWSALLNLALLIVWFVLFLTMHSALMNWHAKWFKLSRETFDAIHYAGMAFYKILIWSFMIMPYLALRIML